MRKKDLFLVALASLILIRVCQAQQTDRDKCLAENEHACFDYAKQLATTCLGSAFPMNCVAQSQCYQDRGISLSAYNNSCPPANSGSSACVDAKKELEDSYSASKCDKTTTSIPPSIAGYIRKSGDATVLVSDVGNHVLKITNQDTEQVKQNINHHVVVAVDKPNNDAITASSIVWTNVFADSSGKLLTLQDRRISDRNIGVDKDCGYFYDNHTGHYDEDFPFPIPANVELGEYHVVETSGAGVRSAQFCLSRPAGLEPEVFHVKLHIDQSSQCFRAIVTGGPSTWVHIQVTLYRKFPGEPPSQADQLPPCSGSLPPGTAIPPTSNTDVAIIEQAQGSCSSDGATAAFLLVNDSTHTAEIQVQRTIRGTNAGVSSIPEVVPGGQHVFLGCNVSLTAGQWYDYRIQSVTWKN